jgi:hypothetical protein
MTTDELAQQLADKAEQAGESLAETLGAELDKLVAQGFSTDVIVLAFGGAAAASVCAIASQTADGKDIGRDPATSVAAVAYGRVFLNAFSSAMQDILAPGAIR